jgi:uncharacterized zinc-type alcohol dehydrogenase-like protein
MSVHAHAALEPKGNLRPFAYEPGPLGPHEVEIRVGHCGICHSDVHLIDGDWGIGSYPMVPGHEIVGTVAALGPEVTELAEGDRVGVGWQRGACLRCEWCRRGEENLCPENEAICVDHHGGFADRVRVDARFAFPIPGTLSSAGTAPLLCGGITVFTPLRRLARPGMAVGILGIGGLGHLAVQFARAMGAVVTALSSSPEKEADCRALGAERFIATADAKALRAAADSLDLIVSTVFLPPDWKALLRALRPGGTLWLLGAPEEPLTVPTLGFVVGHKTVTGSAIGGRPLIREMLDFAARHGIAARVQVRPLAEADAAVEDVRRGRARYRIVLEA